MVVVLGSNDADFRQRAAVADRCLHGSNWQRRCRHPEVKWAEREDKVYLTVMLPDAKNPKVNLAPEGTFTFSATGGAGDNVYELTLELFDKVNVEESKISYGVRSIFCVLEKAEKKWWNKLLRGEGPADFDLGGMDFSKFGDMGGALGGLGGLGGGDEFEDSDDDEAEVSKPEEGAEREGDEKLEGAAAAEKTEASSA
uniref:Co-chaperone protein p23 n=1 Tax=Chenopodium quinoa TaxID=63459 RepID=A0A803MPB3_CHEQI